jgi:hypothetical protein
MVLISHPAQLVQLPAPVPTAIDAPTAHLDLDAGERETLLAALEIALNVANNRTAMARQIARAAYHSGTLAKSIDRLADRVFVLGRTPTSPAPAALPAAA